MIRIRDLCMVFSHAGKEEKVLDSLTLSVEPGEIVAVVGPSGCGKTTLANILAGYLRPTSGAVSCNGKGWEKPDRTRILIAQEDDLFPWMTVEQNIRYFAREDTDVEMLLCLVHLQRYRSYYPSRLSGGMKRRTSLARALAADPEVIILDESFGFLDTAIKDRLYAEVQSIWMNTRKTIILITHDIEEAVLLADRVVTLSGKPATIRDITNVDLERPRVPGTKYKDTCIALRKRIERGLSYHDDPTQ